MRVLMFSLDPTLTDPDSQTARRLKKFSSLVDLLEIVVYGRKKVRDLRLADNIIVHSTGTKFKPFFLRQAFYLGKQIIEQKQIEVITTQDPFESGLIGLRLKKKFKIGLNVQLHGDFFNDDYYNRNLKSLFRLKLARKVLPQADSVRVVSQRIAQSLSRFNIPKEKIVIAPIFVDLHKFRPVDKDGEEKDEPAILAVGRLVKVKNFDLLIRAFKEVSLKYNRLRLVIYGQGPEENNLKSLSKSLSLSDKIDFKGWSDNPEQAYQEADIFVSPSQSEGYNRTIIEAMASGLPVVATDTGLVGEIARDQQNCLIVSPKAEDLAVAIDKLISDNSLRSSLAAAGLKTVRELPEEAELMKLQLQAWQLAIL